MEKFTKHDLFDDHIRFNILTPWYVRNFRSKDWNGPDL